MEPTKNPKTSVTVVADATGNVIVPSKNNVEWGYIQLKQRRMIIDENNFVRPVDLSVLIPGKIEDLKSFGYQKGQILDGKIIFKEQLTPFDKKDDTKDRKIAGETMIPCLQDGQQIYRKNFYTLDEKAIDVPCLHTNVEEIKAAFAALKESSAKL